MDYVSYIACTTAGLILSAIAFVGLYDIPVQPIETATILLKPSGFGELFDHVYLWLALSSGFWLILYVWVRTASAIALTIVLYKIFLVNGWLPLMVTIGLCSLIAISLTTVHLRQK